jgi:hypothetical protein
MRVSVLFRNKSSLAILMIMESGQDLFQAERFEGTFEKDLKILGTAT